MVNISIHNVKNIEVEQEVTTTEGLGTYDVIKLIIRTKDSREEILLFGDSTISLPGIILKKEEDDGTMC